MKLSLSLRQKTFTIIVIGSAFLILAFTYMTLAREAKNASKYQIRQTYLSLLLAKETLESKMPASRSTPPDRLIASLNDLTNKKNVFGKKPVLMTKNGTVLYPLIAPDTGQAIDKQRIREMLLTYDLTGEWFRPLSAPGQNNALTIYTPLAASEGIRYILKTTVTLDNLKTVFRQTYQLIAVIFLIVLAFSALVVYGISKKIIDPIKQLSTAAGEIARGHLDQEVAIKTGDEIETLSKSFNQMTKELKVMRRRAEDANPLTHLPGNNVISACITKRLQSGVPLAVMHCDLDHFKIYNDFYGLKRGDQVIRLTADVLTEAANHQSNGDNLVGHEGGDDFVVVTDPCRLNTIAAEIIRRFDLRIGEHYRAEDTAQGHLLIKDRREADRQTKDRRGEMRVTVPLISISLAAVTNEKKSFHSYAEIASLLAETKKKAKNIPGSSFVAAEN